MESVHTTTDHHLPFIRIHKNGRVDRLQGNEIVPTSLNPHNDVVSKDVVYSPEHNLSVRMFLPNKSIKLDASVNKLPLLIYFHGGAYITESPSSPVYHNYLTEVVKTANCLAVSVQYRLAPEYPIPAAYDDSWSAIQWIFTHNSDDWIHDFADFDRVFIAGDSAGANISHHMGIRAGKEKLKPRIKGIVMVHPGFWGKDHDVQDEQVRNRIVYIWEKIVSPNSVDGVNDPWFNVVGSGSDISGLGCEKVLVAVAGKDVFWRQGLAYYAEKLEKSGWKGEMQVVEEEEEGHCFHLHNPNSQNASKMMKKFVEFINDDSDTLNLDAQVSNNMEK